MITIFDYWQFSSKIFLDPNISYGHKIGTLGARAIIFFLKWPSWTVRSCYVDLEPIFCSEAWQKNSLSGNSNFRGFFILESISIRGLPRARPKISAKFVARNEIKGIFLIWMNRAHRICWKTLKLTDRKLRTQPYLRRETFLLFHPLYKKSKSQDIIQDFAAHCAM